MLSQGAQNCVVILPFIWKLPAQVQGASPNGIGVHLPYHEARVLGPLAECSADGHCENARRCHRHGAGEEGRLRATPDSFRGVVLQGCSKLKDDQHARTGIVRGSFGSLFSPLSTVVREILEPLRFGWC